AQELAGDRPCGHHSACRAWQARIREMKIYRRVRTDMDISKFKPAIAYTSCIAATPEKVWQALTSAEFSRKYFFGNAVEVDLKVGGGDIGRTPDGARRLRG